MDLKETLGIYSDDDFDGVRAVASWVQDRAADQDFSSGSRSYQFLGKSYAVRVVGKGGMKAPSKPKQLLGVFGRVLKSRFQFGWEPPMKHAIEVEVGGPYAANTMTFNPYADADMIDNQLRAMTVVLHREEESTHGA